MRCHWARKVADSMMLQLNEEAIEVLPENLKVVKLGFGI